MNLLLHLDDVIKGFEFHTALENNDERVDFVEFKKRIDEKVQLIGKYGILDQCIAINQTDSLEEVISIWAILYSGNHYYVPAKRLVYCENSDVPIAAIFEGKQLFAVNSEMAKSPQIMDIDWYRNTDITNRKMCVYETSATSGKPKYVVHGFGFIYEDTLRQIRANGYNSRDKVDLLFSNSFSASLASIFPALLSGATLVLRNTKEGIRETVAFWLDSKITVTTLTTSVFRAILGSQSSQTLLAHSSLRFVCISGERIDANDVKRFFDFFKSGTTLQIAYASTETRTISSLELKEFSDYSRHTVGRIVPGKSIIIEPENDRKSSESLGQISIISNEMALGYYVLGRLALFPQLLGKRVFNIGDLGYLDSKGETLFVIGRTNDVIKIDGRWINLNYLETQIMELTGIRCIHIPFIDGNGFDYLVSFMLSRDIQNFPQDIYTALLNIEILPRYRYELERFSINIHGKIDKQGLRAYHLSKISNFKIGEDLENPEKPSIRNTVLKVWKEVLEIDNIEIGQDFFKDLGGTSLLALVMISALEDDLKIEMKNFKQSDLTTLGSFISYIENFPKLPRLVQIGMVRVGRGNIIFVQNGEGHSYNKLIEPFYNDYNVYILRYNQYNAELYRKGNLFFKEMADLIDTQVRGSFSLVGNSFHGYIASKISENHEGALNVIILDTPFYKFSSRSILKNKSTKNRNAGISLIKLFLNPFKWRKFAYRIKRKIQVKKSPKKPSEFTSSVINIVKYNSSIQVLPNTLYMYFELSGITNVQDIHDWRSKTRGNFKSVDFKLGHLDFNEVAVYKDVAKAIMDFI